MTTLLTRLTQWNERMNGLPRKGLLIAATLALTWLAILLAPLCWPFILAMLFSMALEPLVRLCLTHLKRFAPPRGVLTLLGMLVLFGVLGIALYWIVSRLAHELVSLVHAVPAFVNWLSTTAVPYVKDVYQQYAGVLPVTVMNVVNSALQSLGQSALRFAGDVSATLTSGAVNAATAIPGILLSVVLTVMGTYYMTADRERILAFFRRTFPKNMQTHSLLLKNNLLRALFGQVKSQLTVSLIITTFLVLSFVLYGVKYGLLIGFLIGVMDALPVLGAGLFLIPWCLFTAVLGNYTTAAFLAAVYVGTILIRQISEPRIVGANLGLYPLATMVAMFAGFQLMGFLGLLAGPILLNLLKVVLEADDTARGLRPEPSHARPRLRFHKPAAAGAQPDTRPDGETPVPSDAAQPQESDSGPTEGADGAV